MSSICLETIRALQQLHVLEDEITELKPKQDPKPETTALIEALRAKVPPTVLGHHDRMRVRGKRSLAEVRNGVCAGCHTAVAVGTVNILRRGEDIQLCGNCGRYLFISPETAAQESATAAALEEKPKKPRKKKVEVTH